MATSRGLGNTNPLERGRRLPSVITTAPEPDAEESTPPVQPTQPSVAEEAPKAQPRATKSTKVIAKDKSQVTTYLPTDLVNEARDAVMALMANPAGHRTLSALVEEAVRREIERLRTEYNRGRSFPARQVELQAGRPVGR